MVVSPLPNCLGLVRMVAVDQHPESGGRPLRAVMLLPRRQLAAGLGLFVQQAHQDLYRAMAHCLPTSVQLAARDQSQ